ncbi:MAG: response regulator [Myxococcota bacterium]
MDDEPMVRGIAAEMLDVLGFAVDTCANGHAALACVECAEREGRRYDLVILDLVVEGGMGGQEAVRVLKARWPGLRALVSTGQLLAPAALRPSDHGFDGSLPKPYTFEQLVEAVRTPM